jgi:hypothetical protein
VYSHSLDKCKLLYFLNKAVFIVEAILIKELTLVLHFLTVPLLESMYCKALFRNGNDDFFN